ncbi:olfactory receptor 5V1-like [Carettochelys insculpta]|uniref:olfactory receptor 5V1-like n=1 Tax=Carettochelys insculpta TaxID=44489 RepID=UPI003EBCD265
MAKETQQVEEQEPRPSPSPAPTGTELELGTQATEWSTQPEAASRELPHITTSIQCQVQLVEWYLCFEDGEAAWCQIPYTENMEDGNQTVIVEFILLGFGNVPEMETLLFLLFLLIYIVTMTGNILIITLVVTDQHLQTPMYIFVGNLSFLEICYSSAILPRLLASLLTGNKTISVLGCLVQLYFFGIMANTEALLLTAMSCDRYVAICNPLRYAALMNGRVCFQLVAGCWISSVVLCCIAIVFLFQLTYCGLNEIDHFFCDISPVIKLSCGDTRTLQEITFIVCTVGTMIPSVLTLITYVCIITAILRIPSTTGRKKAFSTCSSHLIVLTVFYGTVFTVYVGPIANTPKVLHKIFSLCYTVLTPMINPVIYSLRNKDVNESLRKNILKPLALRKRLGMGKDKF